MVLTKFYCDNNVKISALMMRGAKRKMRGQGEGTLGTQLNILTIIVKRLGLGLGLGTWIGDLDWGLGLGTWIGDWDWGLGL